MKTTKKSEVEITEAMIQEYYDSVADIAAAKKRCESIRQQIIAKRRKKLSVGRFLVTIKDFVRNVPAHVQEGKRVVVKIVAVLALFLSATTAKADLAHYWDTFYPGQKCIKSQVLRLTIIGLLGNNTYEARGNPTTGAEYVMLKTHKHSFRGPGAVIDVNIKYVMQGELKMQNGFTQMYQFVEECKE